MDTSQTTTRTFPALKQWRHLFNVFSKQQRVIFVILLVVFVLSGSKLTTDAYNNSTQLAPARGGSYTEGIVGSLRFINPLYATSDAERDATELLFAGLMNFDEKGQLVPQLASSYDISEDGQEYTFHLLQNAVWSDGEPITADDVIWTVQALQDPVYKSPYLASWLDVGVEKIDEYTVLFRLRDPYFGFLELATAKILPEHVWKDVLPQSFHLSAFNLQPVTSGPYALESMSQDDLGFIREMKLRRTDSYFGEGYYIENITLLFFKEEDELLGRALSGRIDGFTLQAPVSPTPRGFIAHEISIPRYFAVFLNPEHSQLLESPSVREALNLATDKAAVLDEALLGQGEVVHSPLFATSAPQREHSLDQAGAILLLEEEGFNEFTENGTRKKQARKDVEFEFTKNLSQGSRSTEVEELQQCLARDPSVYPEGEVSGFFGGLTKAAVINFQEKYAADILEPQGLSAGTGDVRGGTIDKLNELCGRASFEQEELQLTLTTVNQPQLRTVANLLREQWEEIGFDIEVETISLAELEQNYLKPRNYDMLLFGQVVGTSPDLFPFWHSGQVADPGLNLAQHASDTTDELLLQSREVTSAEALDAIYADLQESILEDTPAIFLYNPHYLYFLTPNIQGVGLETISDPSRRFAAAQGWYIATKRELK